MVLRATEMHVAEPAASIYLIAFKFKKRDKPAVQGKPQRYGHQRRKIQMTSLLFMT